MIPLVFAVLTCNLAYCVKVMFDVSLATVIKASVICFGTGKSDTPFPKSIG